MVVKMGLIRNVFVAFKSKNKSSKEVKPIEDEKTENEDVKKFSKVSTTDSIVGDKSEYKGNASNDEIFLPSLEKTDIVKTFCTMKINNLFLKEYNKIMQAVSNSNSLIEVVPITKGENADKKFLVSGYRIHKDHNRNYIISVSDSPTWSNETSSDFWNLIHENKVNSVVVLGSGETYTSPYDCTKEIASPSSFFNWPSCSGEKFKKLEVKLKQTIHETSFQCMIKHFTVRKSRHINISGGSSFNNHSQPFHSIDMEVRLFYFYGWSENELESMEPCSINSLLNIIHEIDLWHSDKTSPILVHCQSGCTKRSIPFTIIDYEIYSLNKVNHISVSDTTFSVVKSIPPSKVNFLSSQYYLIYETILLYLTDAQLAQHHVHLSSSTNLSKRNDDEFSLVICANNIMDTLEKINDVDYMENLYEYLSMLTHWLTAEQWSSMQANKLSNIDKNRFVNCVPLDSHRVHLYQEERQPSPDQNVILSDHYINASFINIPLLSIIELIITQAPLECTANDFWTMVEDKQIELVVMLNNSKECYEYWQSRPVISSHLDGIMVQVESENHYNQESFKDSQLLSYTDCHLTERIIHLINFSHRIYTHKVRHIQVHDWDDNDNIPIESILSMAKIIWKYLNKVNYQKQVVLQCEDGISVAGLVGFLVIMIDCLQTNLFMEIDIQLLINKIRQCHPRIVSSPKQLAIIMKCAIKIIQDPTII